MVQIYYRSTSFWRRRKRLPVHHRFCRFVGEERAIEVKSKFLLLSREGQKMLFVDQQRLWHVAIPYRSCRQTTYGVDLRQFTQAATVQVQGAAERQVAVGNSRRLGIRIFVMWRAGRCVVDAYVQNEAPGLSFSFSRLRCKFFSSSVQSNPFETPILV